MIILRNEFIEVHILKRGVTFYRFIHLKDNVDIIVGANDLNYYEKNEHFLGCFVGPLAGRTEMGKYNLELEKPNNLHSGTKNICYLDFDVTVKDDSEAIFNAKQDQISYKISVKLIYNKLLIRVLAIPTTPRPINITNHMYFNLEGEQTLENHFLKIDSKYYSHVDGNMFNQYDLRKVDNTLFDFRNYQKLSNVIYDKHEQFLITKHIDHSFKSNQLYLRSKNRILKVSTTTPFIHLYFANYFENGFYNKEGNISKDYSAIAIEPQWLPNDDNLPIYSENSPFLETFIYEIEGI